MRLEFWNIPSLVSIAVAGLFAGIMAIAGTGLFCAIGAALLTAFLIQVRFFYEVPAANRLERFSAFLVLILLFAGLWFATVLTLDILGGVFMGIVVTAVVRRVIGR